MMTIFQSPNEGSVWVIEVVELNRLSEGIEKCVSTNTGGNGKISLTA